MSNWFATEQLMSRTSRVRWMFFCGTFCRLCQRLQGRSWHLQLARWSFLPGAMVRRKTVPWLQCRAVLACLGMSWHVLACLSLSWLLIPSGVWLELMWLSCVFLNGSPAIDKALFTSYTWNKTTCAFVTHKGNSDTAHGIDIFSESIISVNR